MNTKKLSDLRKEIDKIDSRIIELVNKRGKIGNEIGQVKSISDEPLYNPARETQIYQRIIKNNKGPLKDKSIKAIYREIMSACLSLQKPMTVAYLGPEATFTHQAALKKFGASVKYLSCDNISDVFGTVEKGNAIYGVVPIENSTEGAVNHTLDMLVDSPLMICAEVYSTIRHSLLSKTSNIKSIKRIYSKPEVFGQCRKWIEKNVPTAALSDTSSTVKGALTAAKHSASACIASELAAKRYKLKVLARSIEDSATNVTRFLVISKQMNDISKKDKTSVMFSVQDKPGILHDMLSSFKNEKINLTKIESRPSKKKLWKYYFFIDMEGHAESSKIKKVLADLEKKCHFLKILGSYPFAK